MLPTLILLGSPDPFFCLAALRIKTVAGAVFAFLAANPVVLVIGAIAGAIALLAAAWRNNLGDIQGKTKTTFNFLKKVFEDPGLILFV